jgi:transcriptional regulator with XRE-family HTH domain
MDFAEQMKLAMQKKNITQSELSSMTGISKSGISQYLSGKKSSEGKHS